MPTSRLNPFAALTRRRWLQNGGALAGALLWPQLLRAQQAARGNAPAKQAIVIYLQGGLSHYESFDPKPDAPPAYRGTFGSAPTGIPGVHFAEHLPLLARRAHKFNLIRSAYVEAKNRNAGHPSIGSVIAARVRSACAAAAALRHDPALRPARLSRPLRHGRAARRGV
jgi:uncharacterized protein (DUF1501 family)